MKKLLSVLLALAMMASVFTACTQSEETTPSQETEATSEQTSETTEETTDAEPVHLTFFTQEATSSDEALAYYERVVESFTEKYPHITVELLQGGDWQDVDAKLNAARMSNTYPDVLLLPLGSFSSRASLGEFMDITSYIDNWSEKDDIYDASLNVGKFQGVNYGVGVFPVPELIMYRKDYFEEVGLDPETPPTTWDELYSYAEQLTVKDEAGNTVRGGFDVPIADPNLTLMEAFMRQAGNEIINTEDEIVINEPSGVAAMEYLKSFIDNGLTLTYSRGNDDPILSGKSAMGIVYLNAAKSIMNDDPELAENIGFFAYTEGEQAASFNGYRVMMISEQSQNPDEAFMFIDHFYSAELMWERYELLQNIPVRESLSEDFLASDPVINAVVLDSIANGYGRPVSGKTNFLSSHESLAYEEIMSGVKTPQQALDDAVAAANADIEAAG